MRTPLGRYEVSRRDCIGLGIPFSENGWFRAVGAENLKTGGLTRVIHVARLAAHHGRPLGAGAAPTAGTSLWESVLEVQTGPDGRRQKLWVRDKVQCKMLKETTQPRRHR